MALRREHNGYTNSLFTGGKLDHINESHCRVTTTRFSKFSIAGNLGWVSIEQPRSHSLDQWWVVSWKTSICVKRPPLRVIKVNGDRYHATQMIFNSNKRQGVSTVYNITFIVPCEFQMNISLTSHKSCVYTYSFTYTLYVWIFSQTLLWKYNISQKMSLQLWLCYCDSQ